MLGAVRGAVCLSLRLSHSWGDHCRAQGLPLRRRRERGPLSNAHDVDADRTGLPAGRECDLRPQVVVYRGSPGAAGCSEEVVSTAEAAALTSPNTDGFAPSPADVTVVIPALNRAMVIGRALNSVHAQDPAPAAVIVVDDGSDDATGSVAEARGATVVRIAVRGGSGPARNAGIALVATEWVAFLDSDDEWLGGHLAGLLAAAAGSVLVCSPAMSTTGRLLGNPAPIAVAVDPVRMLVPGDLVVTSATMVRTAVIRRAGGFRALPRAQDLDLWLRVLELGAGTSLGGRPTVRYHEHPGQASRDQALMRRCFDDIMNTYADRPWLSRSVWARSYARVHWDDLRHFEHEHNWAGVAGELSWFVQHPAALPAARALLVQRRRARAAAVGQA